MSNNNLISFALLSLMVLTLPQWKYSRIWGGSYTPATILGFMMAAHVFTALR